MQESKLRQAEEEIRVLGRLNEKNAAVIQQLEQLKQEQEEENNKHKRQLQTTRQQLQSWKSNSLQNLDLQLQIEQLKVSS
jgi:hypothetical protein